MTVVAQASVKRWQHYYTPATVAEAVEILNRYDGEARVVGGGTDLLVETRRGLHKPVTAMVDVTHIEGLGEIFERETANGSAGAIAHHLEHAGETSRAIDAYVRAARANCDSGAYQEAGRNYRRAWDLRLGTALPAVGRRGGIVGSALAEAGQIDVAKELVAHSLDHGATYRERKVRELRKRSLRRTYGIGKGRQHTVASCSRRNRRRRRR